MPPILYLIDGHALAYRTYFALTSAGGDRFKTSSGEPTAGTYGFISAVIRLLEQEHPEYLAVAFDTGKTFRNEIFPDYKATRAKMPDDLRQQIERIKELVDAFNFPRLEMEGYEADDVLGSVAKMAVNQGFGVKIMTGDRDLLQLVDDRIIVNLAGRKLSEAKDYTPEDVKEYMGVRPDQIVDLKALMGDSSDNIPGVPGIGEKSALSLFEKYETLDEIFEHVDEYSTRVKNRLADGKELAYKSQELARIHTDVKISLDLEQARTNRMNTTLLDELFSQLEFRSLRSKLKTLGKPEKKEKEIDKQQLSLFGEPVTHIGTAGEYALNTIIINSEKKLQNLVAQLSDHEIISFDTETTSTDPMLADLVGISLAVKEGEGYYIPVGHQSASDQLPLEEVIKTLQPFFNTKNKKLVGHNVKYDGLVLKNHGMQIDRYYFDTMIAEWLIDPATRRLGLKDLATHYLGANMTRIEELIGKGKNQISMAEVAVDKAAPYAAADAEIPLKLMGIQQERMHENDVEKLFQEMEMPLIPVLVEMEKNGISLNAGFFEEMSSELHERQNEIQDEVYRIVGYPFNLNSTQQLSVALFETLKLDPPDRRKKTASGHYSTSADILEQLSGKHEVIDLILEYRELSKLQSTYVDTLPQQINPKTGRVHTSFNQTGSVTGRLASSNPNLQNIPTRTELGRKVRRGFISAEGNLLVAVDYSQIELRIVAHMAKDEAMLEAFRQKQDIHATTAAAVYSIPLAEVTKDQRRHAKAINFGLIYGMSAFGLSNSTGLTLAESEDFVKAYFEKFPGVSKYLDNIRRFATTEGYVETLSGRRRYFPNLATLSNQNVRRREEREAINAPIQGTAADIIKIAMIKLLPELKKENLSARVLLQVHDELILECPENEVSKTVQIVKKVMENAFTLSIPLVTDARVGNNWEELKAFSG